MSSTVAPVGPSTRTNSIAFLRLVLAALVIYSHSSDLGGFPLDPIGRISADRWNLGGVAVDGFFFLSGLLIAGSYIHCRSVWRYLWHRFLRIFPGFWVCLVVVAFCFAPIVYFQERCTLAGFLTADTGGPISYLTANALLDIHQWSIYNLLWEVPYKHVFNGSLWTLATEFRCYLLVAVIGVLGVLSRARWLTIALFIPFFIAGSTIDIAQTAIGSLPGFLRDMMPTPEYIQMIEFFLIGCIVCVFDRYVKVNAVAFGIALVVIPLACLSPYYNVVVPFALSYALYWLAFKLPIRNFDRYGDFSYGTYIYAFPVQQMLALSGLYCLGFWPYFGLSCLVTAPLAIASWFLVERNALALKNVKFPFSFPPFRMRRS